MKLKSTVPSASYKGRLSVPAGTSARCSAPGARPAPTNPPCRRRWCAPFRRRRLAARGGARASLDAAVTSARGGDARTCGRSSPTSTGGEATSSACPRRVSTSLGQFAYRPDMAGSWPRSRAAHPGSPLPRPCSCATGAASSVSATLVADRLAEPRRRAPGAGNADSFDYARTEILTGSGHPPGRRGRPCYTRPRCRPRRQRSGADDHHGHRRQGFEGKGPAVATDVEAEAARRLALEIAGHAAEKKAQDIVVLDMAGAVTYTDYFVIATGATARQTRAIADEVQGKLRADAGGRPASRANARATGSSSTTSTSSSTSSRPPRASSTVSRPSGATSRGSPSTPTTDAPRAARRRAGVSRRPRRSLTAASVPLEYEHMFVSRPGHPARRHGRLLRLGRAGAATRPAWPARHRRRAARRPRRRLDVLLRGARLRRAHGHADRSGRAPLSSRGVPAARLRGLHRRARASRRDSSAASPTRSRWRRSTRPTSTSPAAGGSSARRAPSPSASRSRCMPSTASPAPSASGPTKLSPRSPPASTSRPASASSASPTSAAGCATCRSATLHGIGPVTAERLAALGLITVGMLQDVPFAVLAAAFGRGAHGLRQLALGRSLAPVCSRRPLPKSVGRETTFAEDTNDLELLRATLLGLADRAVSDLRRHGLAARTVALKVRFSTFHTVGRHRTLRAAGGGDAGRLPRPRRTARRARRRRPLGRLVGVSLGNLTHGAFQLTLDEGWREIALGTASTRSAASMASRRSAWPQPVRAPVRVPGRAGASPHALPGRCARLHPSERTRATARACLGASGGEDESRRARMNDPGKVRNVALVGHRGTGKTSLFEALLYDAGVVTRLGSVADGTTVSDWDDDEKKRQLSLSAGLAHIDRGGLTFNLIDTPGDSSFLADTIASLQVVETALMLVNSVLGVEVQTERLWSRAAERGLARVLFCNMLDRERADFGARARRPAGGVRAASRRRPPADRQGARPQGRRRPAEHEGVRLRRRQGRRPATSRPTWPTRPPRRATSSSTPSRAPTTLSPRSTSWKRRSAPTSWHARSRPQWPAASSSRSPAGRRRTRSASTASSTCSR